MGNSSYEAIVVGGRCAGAPLAMLLAREGHRVLLVDKATFPSDTLSTHFVWPRGFSYLNKWGLLERVRSRTPSFEQMDVTIDGIDFSGSVPHEALVDRFRALHADDAGYVTTRYGSTRRQFLDDLLVRAAVEAGAEVRTDFEVREIVRDGERVIGVRGRTRNGPEVLETAKVVVGADGRKSTVARGLGIEKKDRRPKSSFAFFGYFEGLRLERAQLHRRGRLGIAMVPTNDDLTMALLFGPAEWFDAFRRAPEANHLRGIGYVHPELGARLRDEGRRAGRFQGTADMSAYWRTTWGPGFALVGDAACFKDQATAMGMTHAFRDADLAASAIHDGLSGVCHLDEALESYARKHFLDGIDYYNFVAGQAEMTPSRLDEQELFEAISSDPVQRARFIAAYGDTLPLKKFMSRENIRRILSNRPPMTAARRRAHETWLDEAYQNPFASAAPTRALTRNAFYYARLSGPDIVGRTDEYADWVEARREAGTWPYTRFIQGRPDAAVRQVDERGRPSVGINFANQDYLSLAAHPVVQEAAMRALRDFGPHSAGSPMGVGNTTLSAELESVIAEHLEMEHVLLFPTGWAAGFGVIAGLVGLEDHVLMDSHAHNCLQLGAKSVTNRIERHLHLDPETTRHYLRSIRAKDARGGILVVTEGLFSMDSDWPRIEALQSLCHEHGATLVVDVAHDLGATGPNGTGQLGLQRMLGKVDLVVGTFSKVFASNGGFLATRSAGVKQFVKHFAGSHIYSNGLSPSQCAVASAAFSIVRSPEGEALRAKMGAVVDTLRATLAPSRWPVAGQPSPIIPVVIGDERLARLAHRRLYARGIGANMVEFPVVESGKARFRLQAMASHTTAQAEAAGHAIAAVLEEAEAELHALEDGDVTASGVRPRPEVLEWRKVRTVV